MSESVTNIIQKQMGGSMPGTEKQQLQQSQGNRSFESVMQQQDGQTGNVEGQRTNKINDPKLQEMMVDLTHRYQNLPNGVPSTTAILPEYLDTKTSMKSFREILGKAVGSSPQGTDVKGKFMQVENEWLKLDSIMKSDRDLSQGELLGLQARLYQVSQHIDVLSKVVDQMTSGIKTVLNTNV